MQKIPRLKMAKDKYKIKKKEEAASKLVIALFMDFLHLFANGRININRLTLCRFLAIVPKTVIKNMHKTEQKGH